MTCYNCGHLLPDDSEFCQYCGKRIEKQTSIQENATPKEELNPVIKIQTEEAVKNLKENKKAKKSKVRFCKFCGGQIDAQSKKCVGCGKQYFKGVKFNKFLTTVLILSIVMVTSVILNIVQLVEIENLAGTVSSQKRTVSSQKGKISSLEEKSSYYDTICKELSNGNIGYASNNFMASESIIVVDENETNRKFTLTANWPNSGHVSVSYSGYAARVSFDNDSWKTSTKMTVEPNHEGVTVATFSNDVDSKTFKIIIIVTS